MSVVFNMFAVVVVDALVSHSICLDLCKRPLVLWSALDCALECLALGAFMECVCDRYTCHSML